MKMKRIISSLLLVAIFATSVSIVISCKKENGKDAEYPLAGTEWVSDANGVYQVLSFDRKSFHITVDYEEPGVEKETKVGTYTYEEPKVFFKYQNGTTAEGIIFDNTMHFSNNNPFHLKE